MSRSDFVEFLTTGGERVMFRADADVVLRDIGGARTLICSRNIPDGISGIMVAECIDKVARELRPFRDPLMEAARENNE